jgi:hypothetical protein
MFINSLSPSEYATFDLVAQDVSRRPRCNLRSNQPMNVLRVCARADRMNVTARGLLA